MAPKFGIPKPCVGSINKETVAAQEVETGMMDLLVNRTSVKVRSKPICYICQILKNSLQSKNQTHNHQIFAWWLACWFPWLQEYCLFVKLVFWGINVFIGKLWEDFKKRLWKYFISGLDPSNAVRDSGIMRTYNEFVPRHLTCSLWWYNELCFSSFRSYIERVSTN